MRARTWTRGRFRPLIGALLAGLLLVGPVSTGATGDPTAASPTGAVPEAPPTDPLASYLVDGTLSHWGKTLSMPALAGPLPPVFSGSLGASFAPGEMPALYMRLATASDEPLQDALVRWAGVLDSEVPPMPPTGLDRNSEVAVAALIYALSDATELQEGSLRGLSAEELDAARSLPALLSRTSVLDQGADAFEAFGPIGDKVDMGKILAAAQIITGTVSQTLPTLEDWAEARAAADALSAARTAELTEFAASHASTNGLTSLIDATRMMAQWTGVALRPTGPAPILGADETPEDAIIASLRSLPSPVAALPQSHLDALAGLPPGVQNAVARLVLAYADWMDSLHPTTPAPILDQGSAMVAALGRLFKTVEETAPVLEAYGLLLSHSGSAMMPKSAADAAAGPYALEKATKRFAGSLTPAGDAARTIAWSHGQEILPSTSRALAAQDFPALVLEFYARKGVPTTQTHIDAIHNAAANLPAPVAAQAAHLLHAQLDAEKTIDDAYAHLTPDDLSAIPLLQDPGLVSRVLGDGVISEAELERLRRAASAQDLLEAAFDHAAQVLADAADAVAQQQPAAEGSSNPFADLWHEAWGLVLRAPAFGRFQTSLPSATPPAATVPSGPPTVPPIPCNEVQYSTDCKNDVLFMDPQYRTIMISGNGHTVYDFSKGHPSPTPNPGWECVYQQTQALTLDLGGDDVYLNNAGGTGPLGIGTQGCPPNTVPLRITATAMAVDLGGSDTYGKPLPPLKTFGIQGAGASGVGLLYDVSGDDEYKADEGAQGFSEGGSAGIGILIDAAGDDTYVARDRAQGAAGTFSVSDGLVVPFFVLAGASAPPAAMLVDQQGNDQYLLQKTGGARGQGGAEVGVALLVDAQGNDAYRGGQQGNASAGAFAALVDGDGTDRYSRLHPVSSRPMQDGDCWTNARGSDADPLRIDPTKERFGRFYEDSTFTHSGVEFFIDTQQPASCNPSTGPLMPALPTTGPVVADPQTDHDMDGWPDSLESMLGHGWDPENKTDYPAGLPDAPIEWPPTLPGGRPVPLGSGFILQIPGVLAIGDAVPTVFEASREAPITIDLGGENWHLDSAGADFRLRVAVGHRTGDVDHYINEGASQGSNGLLLDLGGPDTYWSRGASQGFAAGGFYSPAAGILFDGGDSDDYVIEAEANSPGQGSVADRTGATATGGGGEGFALGLLFDNGTGPDHYDAPTRGTVTFGRGLSSDVAMFFEPGGNDQYTHLGLLGEVVQVASGVGGVGVGAVMPSSIAAFFDGGGRDSYRGTSTTRDAPDVSDLYNDLVRGSYAYGAAAAGVSAPLAKLLVDQDRTTSSASLDSEHPLPGGGGVVPTPLLDLPGLGIRIGGTLDDEYDQDSFLLIDAGGDDLYRNNAGGSLIREAAVGAGNVNQQVRGPQPLAAILLDLGGGADTYDALDRPVADTGAALATPLSQAALPPEADKAGVLSQGAGFLGVGILVDQAGDDTYRSRSLSNGVGVWGAGILWDREGDDRYGFTDYIIGKPVIDDGRTLYPVFDGSRWIVNGAATPSGLIGAVAQPSIFGRRTAVAAFDKETQNWDVFVDDLDDGAAPFRIAPDPAYASWGEPHDQVAPAMARDLVVWQDHRGGTWDLYYRKAQDTAPPAVPFATGPGPNQERPATDGTALVWQDDDGGHGNVYLASLEDPATAQRISPPIGDHSDPQVSDSFVVWQTRSSATDDWDLAIYNRKTNVDRLRILDRPGDQVGAVTAAGYVLLVDRPVRGEAGLLTRYDWETNTFTPIRANVLSVALDRTVPSRFAMLQKLPLAPGEHIPNPYPRIITARLDIPGETQVSTVHQVSQSTLLQGAAWQHGLGLLLDEAGIDSYWADAAAQGFAFTTGMRNGYPTIQNGGSNGERLVQAALVDLEGNDQYSARNASQGSHVGAPMGENVAVPAVQPAGIARTPLANLEHPQDLGLLLDLRGSDRYTANQLSQGASMLLAGAEVARPGTSNQAVTPPVPNPAAYADASIGVFADLGHVDQYFYDLVTPTLPLKEALCRDMGRIVASLLDAPDPYSPNPEAGDNLAAVAELCAGEEQGCQDLVATLDTVGENPLDGPCQASDDVACHDVTTGIREGLGDSSSAESLGRGCEVISISGDPPATASDREGRRWTQNTKTQAPPPGAAIIELGGQGLDTRMFDVLDPQLRDLGGQEYAVVLEAQGALELAGQPTITARITHLAPAAVLEPRRVDFFVDGIQVGHRRAPAICPSSCSVSFPFDTTRVVDGAHELSARVHLGLPSGGTTVAFVDDALEVLVDNVPALTVSHELNLMFSPFPYASEALSAAHVAFEIPADVDPAQRGFATVYVKQGTTLVKTLRLWSAVSGPEGVSWDGTNETGVVVPTGNYEIKIDVSDRPSHPVERTRSATVPIVVDSMGPNPSCVRLTTNGPCNGVFLVNTQAGTFNPLTGRQNLVLRIDSSDDRPALGGRTHAFTIGADGKATEIMASGDQLQLSMLHEETVRVVTLMEDATGNLECAPACGARVSAAVAKGSAPYLAQVAEAKAALGAFQGMPTLATLTADLAAPTLIRPTIHYHVNGAPVPFGQFVRVSPGTDLDLTFQVEDLSGGPLTANVTWLSFERNPPLTIVTPIPGVPVPGSTTLFNFTWSAWPDVSAAWPSDVEGNAIMEIDIRDPHKNAAALLSTTVLVDRTEPTIVDSWAEYPDPAVGHADDGSLVKLAAKVFDPAILDLSVPKSAIIVTVDASSITELDGADQMRLTYRPASDEYAADDVEIREPDGNLDASTFYLPLTAIDPVGNINDTQSLELVIGSPHLGAASTSTETAVFGTTLTWSTVRPAHLQIRFAPAGEPIVTIDGTHSPDGLLHRFELNGLRPDTTYLYSILGTDDETGAREAVAGLQFRTALGLGISIETPAAGTTLSGIASVRIRSSALGAPQAQPRVSLSIEQVGVPGTPKKLLEEATQDHIASIDLVTDALPAGTYVLRASASLGPETRTAEVVGLTIDNQSPRISITSPADGALLPTTDVPWGVQADDAASLLDLTTLKVRVNGVEQLGLAPQVTAGPTPGNATLAFPRLPNLDVGSNRIAVTLEDAVGNVGSASLRVFYDPKAPEATALVVYPNGQSAARAGQVVHLVVSATDATGIPAVRLLSVPGIVLTPLDLHRSGLVWTVDVPIGANAPEGPASLRIQVVDRLGHATFVEALLIIDGADLELRGWTGAPSSASRALFSFLMNKPASVVLELSHEAQHATITAATTNEETGLGSTPPGTFRVTLAAENLERDTIYHVKAVVNDAAGRSETIDVQWLFAPVIATVPTLGPLTSRTLLGPLLDLTWSLPDDAPTTGGLWFTVYRSDGSIFRPVARVDRLHWRDVTAAEGTSYRYFVVPENVVGERGPPSPIMDVVTPRSPRLTNATVSPTLGTTETDFRFSAKLRSMTTQDPSVWVIVDGRPYMMNASSLEGDCRVECVLTAHLALTPLDLRTPKHEFHVEVFDAHAALRYPDAGELAGPTVVAAPAGGPLNAHAKGIPALDALPILAVLGVVTLLRRRSQ